MNYLREDFLGFSEDPNSHECLRISLTEEKVDSLLPTPNLDELTFS